VLCPSCQQIVSAERPTDADLQVLIDAWPALPEAIKAGIVAMVRAAGGTVQRGENTTERDTGAT